MKVYDSIIIGAGAAGMTASIYLSRYKVNHLIFGEVIGGQFVDALVIENYPGFTSISGPELARAFQEQVESYGVKIRQEKVEVATLAALPPEVARLRAIKGEGRLFLVQTEKNESFKARSLIIATGRKHRRLDVPGEEKLLGRGVSYCATCDAPLFKGKMVAVVGGGNSALTAAIHAASFAKKVYLIHRRDQYRAEPVWVERMRALKNIEEVLNNTVKGIKGSKSVEGVVLDKPYRPITQSLNNSITQIPVQGVFIEIGFEPVSELAQVLGVRLDEQGSIKVNPDRSTNVPGVFAAGDIAQLPGGVPLNQIVNSAGEGAEAAAAAYEYLCQLEPCKREK